MGAWMEGRPGPRTVPAERSMHSCLQSEREMEMEPTEESGLGEEPQAFSAWFTAQSTGFCGTIKTHTQTSSDRLQEAPHGIEEYPVFKVYPLGQSLD